MRNLIEIENIEEIRLQEGIDDIELRNEIGALRVGAFVKVTLLIGSTSFETLLVRITSMRGAAFRGKLVRKPSSSPFAVLEVGSSLEFAAAHIHSIHRGKPSEG